MSGITPKPKPFLLASRNDWKRRNKKRRKKRKKRQQNSKMRRRRPKSWPTHRTPTNTIGCGWRWSRAAEPKGTTRFRTNSTCPSRCKTSSTSTTQFWRRRAKCWRRTPSGLRVSEKINFIQKIYGLEKWPKLKILLPKHHLYASTLIIDIRSDPDLL